MSKVLETYDPNGEELWDYHVGIAHEVMMEIRRLEAAGQPVPKELHWLWDEHNRAWPKAERSRHRTIQDYVRFHWAFLFAEAAKEGISFPMPAFDDGATIEDVKSLYPYYEEKIKHAIRAKNDKLPEGRPNGLDIFEPGEGRLITSELRHFERRLLDADVVALVSYDLRATESHICLSLVPDETFGNCVVNRYEAIITHLYQEALAQAYQAIQERFWLEVLNDKVSDFLKVGIQAFNYPFIGLIPNNLKFYLFMPAELSFRNEPIAEFQHVPVEYKYCDFKGHGVFWDQCSETMGCVPSYIKHARYIERLMTPSSQPSGVFYRRAAMSFGGTS